ncbi:mycobactin lysine-N-oxygenase [Paraburkholderia sp. BL18I3N2]|nr:SidA/IucD/PvdA family monooxygenase [Paraburkholderia sp. BL18I3N2]PRX26157.1 mycobactin lysine-N-oxygenase [Paraburkholderia sp. BL18I3N2]PRX95380.1 mycobactin lysine-N-oxygenase [Paraburkholderia sp. BL25I1N1]
MDMLDVIGIGIGPFNLSLAALIQPTGLRALFFEKRIKFSWHPGLMLPQSQLQVSPLKDCVTLVNPTSPYSFLNYLAVHRRLYSFVNKGGNSTSRREFTHYYQWVAQCLDTLRFGEEVIDIRPCNKGYCVTTTARTYHARAVVVGVGVEPKVPACARQVVGETVYHVDDYLNRKPFSEDEHVLVVGGGQSGAEVVEHMLTESGPDKITWATSRANLFAMDDNAFVNEAYMPSYSQRFHTLPIQRRWAIVESEKLTSDGISASLCNRLYEALYERSVHGTLADCFRLLPSVTMDEITRRSGRWHIGLTSLVTSQRNGISADRIILATGFQPRHLPFVQKLLDGASREDGLPTLDPDYAVRFDASMPGPVYLQNQSRVQHGLQSVNLSLVAYRNSRIINSLLGLAFYPDVPDRQLLDSLEDQETEAGSILCDAPQASHQPAVG